MDLKDFRKIYGQKLPLKVCRNAYDYMLNGNPPKPSVGTACAIYAKDFIDNPLQVIGYRAEEEIGCVHVYRVMTESVGAQCILQKGKWNFDDRFTCITRLGENYKQELVKSLKYPDDVIVSIYNHFGKYVSLVALKGCEIASQVKNFKHIGYIFAINSLGYYNRYLDNMTLTNQCKSDVELNYLDKYLMEQPLEITPANYSNQHVNLSFCEYLNRKNRELGTCISIVDIKVFGNFENL